MLTHLSSKGKWAFRKKLYEEQGGCCCWCQSKMVLDRRGKEIFKQPPENYATFEHLIDDWATPDGKDQSLSAIRLACCSCNSARNSRRTSQAHAFYRSKFGTPREFYEFCNRKKPADFIRLLGPWEQFTHPLPHVTMNYLEL